MIERELKNITEDALRELIAEGASEGKTLEFKRSLDVIDATAKADAKLKFLRGVASFANGSGGDMVFGIVANKDGKAEGVVPLANFNPDRDTLRLRDLIRMNIEPRSAFVEFKPVELSAGGHALVIRIRKSWAGAHFVTHDGDFRFFTRDHGGKRPMDIPEIRNAFTLSEGIAEKINRFRLERVANILANETPESLILAGRIVLHLCPFSSFEPGKKCDLRTLQNHGLAGFRPLAASGYNSRDDVEGYYVYQPGSVEGGVETAATAYTLASHSGWIEAVESYWLRPDDESEKGRVPNILPTGGIEPELVNALAAYFEVLKAIGAEPPVVVMLSFLNVRGFIVYLSPAWSCQGARRIARDNILIPGSVVETLDVHVSDRTKANAIDIMRPMFDVLWNACGLPKSRHFDAEGNWKSYH